MVQAISCSTAYATSPASVRSAWKKALRKYVPYYLKNYVFFPLLAGPFFWKVLLGNWLAETIRPMLNRGRR